MTESNKAIVGAADYFFPGRFDECRRSFLEACDAAGARVETFAYDTLRDPWGKPLACDVAVLGRADATKRLLIVSGMHGLEGHAGSAVQTAWIRSGQYTQLASDTAAVLVHAINPFGFAHDRRNEDTNVDPNRNFFGRNEQPPANPNYAQLHDLICPRDWTATTLADIASTLQILARDRGMPWVTQALIAGQVEFPEGLFYAGREATWPIRTLATVLERYAAPARHVGYVDFHTGLGARGETVCLCFHDSGTAARERARRWYGAQTIDPEQRPDGQAEKYFGVSYDGVARTLAGTNATIVCVEFGTAESFDVLGALVMEHWLQFSGAKAKPERAAMLKHVRETFAPTSSEWRRGVLSKGMAVVEAGLKGLAMERD